MQKITVYGNGVLSVVKGVGIALLSSFLFSVAFALALRFAPISEKLVYPVNQLLKGASILLGVLFSVRGEKGWLKGGGVGGLFTALGYLAFSAAGGDFSLSWLIFLEGSLALLLGGISGALAVNLRK